MAGRSHTVGIIGLGFGRAHIPAFQACGSIVVAVCQRNLSGPKAIAER
jgi:predicted dehydrogenase